MRGGSGVVGSGVVWSGVVWSGAVRLMALGAVQCKVVQWEWGDAPSLVCDVSHCSIIKKYFTLILSINVYYFLT